MMKNYIAGKRVVSAQGKAIGTKKTGSQRGYLQGEVDLKGVKDLRVSGGRGMLVE